VHQKAEKPVVTIERQEVCRFLKEGLFHTVAIYTRFHSLLIDNKVIITVVLLFRNVQVLWLPYHSVQKRLFSGR